MDNTTLSPRVLCADATTIARYRDDAEAVCMKRASARGRAERVSGGTPGPTAPITSAYGEMQAYDAALTDVYARCGVPEGTTANRLRYLVGVLTNVQAMQRLGLSSTDVRHAYATVHDYADFCVRMCMPVDRAVAHTVWAAEIAWHPARIAAMLSELCGVDVKPGRVSMAEVRGKIPLSSRRTTSLSHVAVAIGVAPLPMYGLRE